MEKKKIRLYGVTASLGKGAIIAGTEDTLDFIAESLSTLITRSVRPGERIDFYIKEGRAKRRYRLTVEEDLAPGKTLILRLEKQQTK